MKKHYYYIPICIFIFLTLFFGRHLFINEDPSFLPSVLINENFPNLEFNQLEKYNLLTMQDIFSYKHPALVNIWSSWCVPCRVEHKNLLLLKNKYNIRIYGINYKDDLNDAKKVLEFDGNPFYSIGVDQPGRAVINLGVYGVPETFIIDKNATIRYRHVGPILDYDIKETILPILTDLEKDE